MNIGQPRLLGAVLAGGRSRRFGSDKALALLAGLPLIEHVAAVLEPQVHEMAVCGRAWGALRALADRPAPGLGPLGGLSAALRFASDNGFDAVLTAGCDMPDLPANILPTLGRGPAVVAGQPLVGLWPARLADALDRHLEVESDRSLGRWAVAAGAREVPLAAPLANLNDPDALAAFAARRLSAPERP